VSVSVATRVLVVDDHAVVRQGIADVLRRQGDMDVVGLACDAVDALLLLESVPVDVAVVDYGLPTTNGAELCRLVTLRHPRTKVIILTTFLDDAVVGAAVRAGAAGYFCKDVEPADLAAAVRSVAGGATSWDPKVDGAVDQERPSRRDMRAEELSLREIDVIRLVSRGLTNDEIALQLGVSHHSVKSYVRRAMTKLGATRRTELAAVAVQRGLT
jgi:DNA-binding NarL/FixJ family response regulator